MITKWVIFAIVTFLCLSSDLQAASAGSEFEMDKDLINKLYQQTLTEGGVDVTYKRGYFDVTPQFSIIFPSSFALFNDYFTVPYSDTPAGILALSVTFGTPIVHWGDFKWTGQLRFGYGYKEGNYKITSKSPGTASVYTDVIKLHRMPLSVGSQLSYPLPGIGFIEPCVTFGVGAEYLYQTGRLDGLDQGFWVPFTLVSPALSFFKSEGGEGWFGGLTVGATFQSSFASSQVVRGLSYDAGVTLLF